MIVTLSLENEEFSVVTFSGATCKTGQKWFYILHSCASVSISLNYVQTIQAPIVSLIKLKIKDTHNSQQVIISTLKQKIQPNMGLTLKVIIKLILGIVILITQSTTQDCAKFLKTGKIFQECLFVNTCKKDYYCCYKN